MLSLIPGNLDERIAQRTETTTAVAEANDDSAEKKHTNVEATCTHRFVAKQFASAYFNTTNTKKAKRCLLFCIPFEILSFRNKEMV